MHINLPIDNQTFNKLKTGEKTVDMSLLDDKRRYLTFKDTVTFINQETEEQLEAEVVSVHIYPTFKELYADFRKEELGYATQENASYLDMEKYYPITEQEKYCVVGVEVKVIK